MDLRTEQDILDLIRSDAWMMRVLETVASVDIPDAWIGAGFVRNKVWDTLHGMFRPHGTDIDVAYFDPNDLREEREKEIDAELERLMPGPEWSAKNQARMHAKHGDLPYVSTLDGIAHWTETATCVAVRLRHGILEFRAMHGIEDLLRCVARPTPAYRTSARAQMYADRLASKQHWKTDWPLLRFEQ